jgi:putative membrane protein
MALSWSSAYPWIKAFHVIAIIAWMAGMLYLPRLFVYHCQAPKGSPQSEMLKLMERRLLKAIINPSMVAAWILGLLLAWQGGFFTAAWFHAKLALVVVMSGVHGYYAGSVRRFAKDRNRVSERTWRLLNEVPTLLMVGIVLLVILKPF